MLMFVSELTANPNPSVQIVLFPQINLTKAVNLLLGACVREYSTADGTKNFFTTLK